MSALAAIVIGAAARIGAPIVKSIVEKHAGPLAGSLAGSVLDAIAGKAGVPVDQLGDVPPRDLETAIRGVERDTPEIVTAWTEQQKEANRLMLAEMDRGDVWTWAWRPFWMWLLAFLWTYTFALLPVANAAFGASIAAPDPSLLVTLTLAYLGLYMGGHTVKQFAGAGK